MRSILIGGLVMIGMPLALCILTFLAILNKVSKKLFDIELPWTQPTEGFAGLAQTIGVSFFCGLITLAVVPILLLVYLL